MDSLQVMSGAVAAFKGAIESLSGGDIATVDSSTHTNNWVKNIAKVNSSAQ